VYLEIFYAGNSSAGVRRIWRGWQIGGVGGVALGDGGGSTPPTPAYQCPLLWLLLLLLLPLVLGVFLVAQNYDRKIG